MKITIILLFFLATLNSYGQTWEMYNTSNSEIPSNNVSGISISDDSTVWISTLSGIASFDDTWQKHGINNSTYSYDEIINIWCVDTLIWIGTEYRGLWSYDGLNNWTNFHPNSAGNGIVGFGNDSNDTIWILDKFGNFEKWNGSNWIEISDFFSQGNGLFIDTQDNIWLLSNNSGLEKYYNGELLIDYDNTWDPLAEDYIPDASIHDMVEDSEGNYWIGGNYKGLIKFNGADYTVFDTTNSEIASNKIRALAIDDNDVLWIGTWDNGISKFDGTSWVNYNPINSPLSSNIINDIEIGIDGQIWIANGYNEFRSPGGGQGIMVLDENSDISGGVIPIAPSELKIKGISVAEVILNWTDNSDNETGFIIERSINDQNHFEQIKFINRDIASFTDYSVSSESIYYYRIAAVNSVDTSGYTNIDSITPRYCTVNKSSYSCYANVTEIKFGEINNSVFNTSNGYYDYLDMQTELKPDQTILMTVTFDRYSITSDDIIGGEIYIDWNVDGDFDDENELIFQDLNINGKATYSFPVHVPEIANLGLTRLRTRADDDTYNNIEPCGYAEETQDYSLIISEGIPIAIPSEVTATSISSDKILLNWNDNSSLETSYLIERSTDSINFDQSYLIAQNIIEFIDSNLVAGAKYFYRIAALSDSDTSKYSEIISARTLSVDFYKVLNGDIATNKYFTVGAFWGDYNNDGNLDVFTSGDNILYSNVTEMLNNSALPFKSSGSASWGDYNNDGNLDIFITSYNYAGGTPNNILYRNNGDNSFTEIIPFESDDRVNNCVWLDFNNDGQLDIFLSYLDLNYGKLYLNKGNETFEEVLELEGASGFSNFVDYDSDGDLDLFVFKYNNNILYNNNGDGKLTRSQNNLLTFFSNSSNGASWGDIDNDGDMDLFVANGRHSSENNSLYINLGNGSFYQSANGDIVSNGGESYGSSFCDIDNDGNLDLVVANFQQKNFLYMGNGDGTFNRINQSIIENESLDFFHDEIPSMGCAFGDYNNDGFSDLMIANNSGAENFLYENSGNQNNWIKLDLKGTQSNKSAIGAKIQLITNSNSQFREIMSQSGFGGQNELIANFGLGNKTEIDSIIVQWPSGITQVLTDISSNQTLEIVESSNNTSIANTRKDVDFIVYPNPAKNQITITGINESKISTIEVLDINGRVLVSKRTSDNILSIDISEFPNGIYLLKTVINKSVFTSKIIKQ